MAFITFSNPPKSSDCAPSESARSGQGCTSIINPSAPTATAARETAAIRLCFPVPCEGSAITGRCERSRANATAARSNVFRISVSKEMREIPGQCHGGKIECVPHLRFKSLDPAFAKHNFARSEEHTSELQSPMYLV